LDTGIFADALPGGSSGNGGKVAVQTSNLTILDGGEIASITFGQGKGGDVTVMAGSLLITGFSSGIFANTADNGKGGNVTAQARCLTITDGGEVSSSTSG